MPHIYRKTIGKKFLSQKKNIQSTNEQKKCDLIIENKKELSLHR